MRARRVRDYQRVATAESRAKQLDRGGFTPLMYAARENCGECVEVLLKHKVDVNQPDPSGMSPIVIAIMNSNWDIAKRLIEAGADVNEWDMFGQAPLHVAISNMTSRGNGDPLDMDKPNKATGREIVQMLVDRGANPNQQLYFRAAGRGFGGGTGRGTTPFMVACSTGDLDVVKLLLAHGADPQAGNLRRSRSDHHRRGFARRRYRQSGRSPWRRTSATGRRTGGGACRRRQRRDPAGRQRRHPGQGWRGGGWR